MVTVALSSEGPGDLDKGARFSAPDGVLLFCSGVDGAELRGWRIRTH